ncbi:MAG TPA: cysteine peptidase family C39 domain-containing protein, partial [Polyangia bacterium]
MTSPPADPPRRRFSRRFWAPEVIQTSAMDCGPAALKCLLEGFAVPVSYGRLREACQTSVDGTSIDTLETLARTVGLDAEQVMMPADHLLLPESEALPAIVVVRLPSGLMHFVVVWRVHGAWVQVMDPARGRRWLRKAAFLREVYVHTMKIPAESFREWAGSDGFLLPLRRRLARLGLADSGEALVAAATGDPTWRGLAALDAAVRTVSALVDASAVRAGDEASRLCAGLVAQAAAPPTDAPALPVRLTTASDAPHAEDGTPQVTMRGAVLVRVGGAEPLDDARRAALPRELRAAIEEPPVRPAAAFFALLRQDGLLRWSALALGLALAAGGAVLEALIFRGLFDLAAGRASGLVSRLAARVPWRESAFEPLRGVPVVAVTAIVAVAALLALDWPVSAALRGAGRRLEGRLRLAFLRKIPRLGDRYFGSRPVSDMAERAHLAHRLRALPALGGQLMRAALELVVTAGALCWIYPSGAPLVIALAASMLLLPLLAQPALAERDLRMRNHAGALSRFYLDALLGLVAIRTHRAEDAVSREHGERLAEWLAAARAALRAALVAETAQTVVGVGLAAALLLRFVGGVAGANVAGAADPGSVLLVVYWSLALPALGQEIAAIAQQLPSQRNVTLRLVEPLGAPEDDAQGDVARAAADHAVAAARAASTGASAHAARVELRDVLVQAGGHTILTAPALDVAPGEHVAVVGPSGAGKSSLVGLLLGWHRSVSGSVRVDGSALEGQALERLRRETVWVDPTVYLWNRSLHENLAYGLAAAPPSLEAAIAEAELAGVVERLPRGGESPLGEAGALLSGGEGQRVRFGRGVARPAPRLVILDEPFRGLSRDQRRLLLARARARWADATLLCVTHDIEETLPFARVLVVADGRIVEDAAPAALASRPGSRYAQLLEAERRVRHAAWSRAGAVPWRRLRMEGGRLADAPETA